jgi:cholecystokinin-like receptor
MEKMDTNDNWINRTVELNVDRMFTSDYVSTSSQTSLNLHSLYSTTTPVPLILLENASTTVNINFTLLTSQNQLLSQQSWITMASRVIPLYSVIFLLAVIGNALVIMTLVQNKRMRTVTNLFLLNLAISDLLLGIFCMPITLVGMLLRDFIFGEIMCKLLPYLQGMYLTTSKPKINQIKLNFGKHNFICSRLCRLLV